MSRPGPGRRPGDPAVTRQTILDAARTRFAAVGFERATIRSIASEADVDPALVHHHFGTKQALFAAAHELPFNPGQLIASIGDLPSDQRAEQITRLYLTMMETADSPPVSLIRAAATNEAAARMLREFVEDVLLSHADDLVEVGDARLRLSLVATHMIGIAFGRTIVEIPALRSADTEKLVTAVTPTIQRYLSDPTLFES